MRAGSILVLSLLLSACAGSRRTETAVPANPLTVTNGATSSACDSCSSPGVDEDLRVRSNERLVELKSRGGECAIYGSVLATSLNEGRVSVRPFMWRVQGRLVSGEARSDGAIVVARDIDPLNRGVRTVDDMLWTLEHEAAHVAFRISNGRDIESDRANQLVRGCRG